MGIESLQFLLSRYKSNLQEVDYPDSKFPLLDQFKTIKLLLETLVNPSMSDPTKTIIKDYLYHLNDAFAKCQLLTTHNNNPIITASLPLYPPKQVYLFFRTKRLLTKLTDKLQTENGNNNTRGISSNFLNAQHRRTSEMCDTSKIFGFNDQMEHIVGELRKKSRDNGLNSVGIVGIGGSGKTTLARLVFNDERVKKEFRPRIWVPLWATLDGGAGLSTTIVQYMLQELGDEEFETSNITDLDKLLVLLHRHLSGKKYLIVFDDVWETTEWYEHLAFKLSKESERGTRLAYGLPKGYGGGIIVTGRQEQLVAKMVEEKNVCRIKHLHPNMCWEIFESTVKEKEIVGSDDILKSAKTEVLEKCAGYPLAAKTLGRIITEWAQSSPIVGGPTSSVLMPHF